MTTFENKSSRTVIAYLNMGFLLGWCIQVCESFLFRFLKMSAVREDFAHNSHVSPKMQIKFVENCKVFAGVKVYGFACTSVGNPVDTENG